MILFSSFETQLFLFPFLPLSRSYVKLSSSSISLKKRGVKTKLRFGRNIEGKVTVRHRGGGTSYKPYNLLRGFKGPCLPVSFIYDRMRRRVLTEVETLWGNYLILGTMGHKLGELYKRSLLMKLNPGSVVSNVGDKYIRLSGSEGVLLELRPNNKAWVIMPSGKIREFPSFYLTDLGAVLTSNVSKGLSKAGHSRGLGRRPVVRGEAMCAVYHPHGGRTRGGKLPRTPWGKLA